MEQDNGRAAAQPGSREPSPDGLGPSAFDPSRKRYRSQGYAMATFDQGRDSDGAPLREVWDFADEDSGSEGEGWLDLHIHEIVETERSGIIAIYYRQWFAPNGQPAFGMQPKRRVGSLASVKALIRRRKMSPCDSNKSGAWGEKA